MPTNLYQNVLNNNCIILEHEPYNGLKLIDGTIYEINNKNTEHHLNDKIKTLK